MASVLAVVGIAGGIATAGQRATHGSNPTRTSNRATEPSRPTQATDGTTDPYPPPVYGPAVPPPSGSTFGPGTTTTNGS